MKRLGLALLTALAVGCGSNITGPSAALDGAAVVNQDAKTPHAPDTLKVTLYFYSVDLADTGQIHVVDLPVSLASVPAGASLTGVTGKQGAINIDVPKASTAVAWEVLPNTLGFCVKSGTLLLPYGVRENWVRLDQACGE